jgi:hypothetical protein
VKEKSENMDKTPRLERAIAIRARALQIIEAKGQWEKTQSPGAPEMKYYDDGDRFRIGFYVGPPEPITSALYTLDLWHKATGKMISLAWDSVGADPEIISFKRGEWEGLFLNEAN